MSQAPREGGPGLGPPWRQVCNLQGVQGLYPPTLMGGKLPSNKTLCAPSGLMPPIKTGVPEIHPEVPPDTNSSQNLTEHGKHDNINLESGEASWPHATPVL